MTAKNPESTLYYTKEGNGKKNLLLFHGFGQDHTAFDAIRDDLGQLYTLYSFDLYFHGRSLWPMGDKPIRKEEWETILTDFLRTNKIDSFSMAGFSIGTKFLLATLEAFPAQTEELFLIAPDGIKPDFWYNVSTRTALFRNLFKSLINRPGWFFMLLNGLQRLRILPKEVIQFARSQMRTPEKRSQVYHSWVVFRELRVHAHQTAHVINQYHIPVNVLIGKHDRIIDEKKVAPLLQHLEQYSLDIEESGHHQLLKRESLQKFFLKGRL